jgi:hypothetical protein
MRDRERFRNAILFHLGGLDLHPWPFSAHTIPEAKEICCQKSAARNLTSAALAEPRETPPDGTFTAPSRHLHGTFTAPSWHR